MLAFSSLSGLSAWNSLRQNALSPLCLDNPIQPHFKPISNLESLMLLWLKMSRAKQHRCVSFFCALASTRRRHNCPENQLSFSEITNKHYQWVLKSVSMYLCVSAVPDEDLNQSTQHCWLYDLQPGRLTVYFIGETAGYFWMYYKTCTVALMPFDIWLPFNHGAESMKAWLSRNTLSLDPEQSSGKLTQY